MPTERGWRTPVAADGKGFPDLVLVRDRIVVAEIKGSDRVKPEQRAWLDAFRLAGTEAYVWTPETWAAGEVERILRLRAPARDLAVAMVSVASALVGPHEGAQRAVDGE